MATYDHTRAAEEAADQRKSKRESQEASDLALAEFFARGGVVQTVANNVSGRVEGSSYSAWGKPKKKAAAAEVVEEAEVEEVTDDLDAASDEDDAAEL